YGSDSKPEHVVVIAYADIDADRLVTMVKAIDGYQGTEHGQHTIHSWNDEKKKPENGVKPRVYASIHGKRIIIGQGSGPIAAALDVLDGGPSLQSSGSFPELGASGSMNFIQGAARKLDLPESDPNATIFKLSKLISLQVGETQQKLNATLS